MRYHNFDIRIPAKVKDGSEYSLSGETKELGEVAGQMLFDPLSPEVAKILYRYENEETDPQFLREAGTFLFETLFPRRPGDYNSTYDLLLECIGRYIPTPHQGIRIRLRINAPEVATVPWEFLYAPNKRKFLATWIRTPLVRYLDMGTPVRKLELPTPANMLIVIPDNPELDVDREKAVLKKALEKMGRRINPTCLKGNVSLCQLDDTLKEKKNYFHILHFIGHGEFREDGGALPIGLSRRQAGHYRPLAGVRTIR